MLSELTTPLVLTGNYVSSSPVADLQESFEQNEWKQYVDPDTGRPWRWNSTTKEAFWEDDGSAIVQTQ